MNETYICIYKKNITTTDRGWSRPKRFYAKQPGQILLIRVRVVMMMTLTIEGKNLVRHQLCRKNLQDEVGVVGEAGAGAKLQQEASRKHPVLKLVNENDSGQNLRKNKRNMRRPMRAMRKVDV